MIERVPKVTGEYERIVIFFENIGNADSGVWYGPSRGRAGNTPLRVFQGYTAQDGVRAPPFIHYGPQT